MLLRGLGGRSPPPPPICKHSARMMGFKKTHMLGMQLAWLKGGAQPPPPPICKHNARIVGFNRSYALKKSGMMGFNRSYASEKSLNGLETRGGWGGGRSPPPPIANTMLA